jgi:hypothetical protein
MARPCITSSRKRQKDKDDDDDEDDDSSTASSNKSITFPRRFPRLGTNFQARVPRRCLTTGNSAAASLVQQQRGGGGGGGGGGRRLAAAVPSFLGGELLEQRPAPVKMSVDMPFRTEAELNMMMMQRQEEEIGECTVFLVYHAL